MHWGGCLRSEQRLIRCLRLFQDLSLPRSTLSLSLAVQDHVMMLPCLVVLSALGLGAWGEFSFIGSERNGEGWSSSLLSGIL